MISRIFIILILVLGAAPAFSDIVIAARTIRPKTILTHADLTVIDGNVPGAFQSIEDAVGFEARVVLYSGRPVLPDNIGKAAIIERNQIVRLVYSYNGLTISAEARALGRAGIGDMLRVMNLASKSTVSGFVSANGTVHVGSLLD